MIRAPFESIQFMCLAKREFVVPVVRRVAKYSRAKDEICFGRARARSSLKDSKLQTGVTGAD